MDRHPPVNLPLPAGATAVMYVSAASTNVATTPVGDQPPGAVRSPDAIPGCVITVLDDTLEPAEESQAVSACDQETVSAGGGEWRWAPLFWRCPAVLRACWGVLLEGLADPVVWALSEYMWGELSPLVEAGLLPPEIPTLTLTDPPKVTHGGDRFASLFRLGVHIPVILRDIDPCSIPLPFHQGFGHFAGVRFAAFERSSAPVDLYSAWIASVGNRDLKSVSKLLVTDDLAPENTSCWLSPFGEENRDQRPSVARLNVDAGELAASIARRLGLPHRWDWDYMLPPDVLRVLEPGATE